MILTDNAENAKFGAWNVKHRKPRLEWQDLKLGSKCCTSLSKVQLLSWSLLLFSNLRNRSKMHQQNISSIEMWLKFLLMVEWNKFYDCDVIS